MWFRFSSIFLFMVYLFSPLVCGQEKDTVAHSVAQLTEDFASTRGFSGTILVAQKDKVVFCRGVGKANLDWGIPNTSSTKYRIGSLTKAFTAALILRLDDLELLDVDETIGTYLPYFRQDLGQRITIRQLLNHASGLPKFITQPGFRRKMHHKFEVKEFVSKWCSGDLEFEPGEGFLYTNAGYFILGAIIEEVTQQRFGVYLQQSLLKPLGMVNTGYSSTRGVLKKGAQGYEKVGGVLLKSRHLNMSIPFAAGALYSTVEDLFLWSQAIVEKRVFSERWQKELASAPPGSYRVGWYRSLFCGADGGVVKRLSHGGKINGFSAFIARFPESESVVIVLSNIAGKGARTLGRALSRVLLGAKLDPVIPTQRDEFWRHIHAGQFGKAQELREKMRRKKCVSATRILSLASQLATAGEVVATRSLLQFLLAFEKGDSKKAKTLLTRLGG